MDAGRPRDTTRHREAAAASRAETRRRLLAAAGAEFEARGYHGATVSRIAAQAGVTVQTLYLAWGSKRALLRAHLDARLSGNPDTPYDSALPGLLDNMLPVGCTDGGRAVAARMARLYRGIAERAAPGWLLYRDAAATDAEVAADWLALQQLRRETFANILGRVDTALLRPGLTPATAAETAWAIASPESYELLVRIAGYDLDAYEQWVADTLTAALFR